MMPRQSIKYHTKNDAYGMFVGEFVEQGELTEDVLTWLMIYESLRKQRYLYDRLPILKSNWAIPYYQNYLMIDSVKFFAWID